MMLYDHECRIMQIATLAHCFRMVSRSGLADLAYLRLARIVTSHHRPVLRGISPSVSVPPEGAGVVNVVSMTVASRH